MLVWISWVIVDFINNIVMANIFNKINDSKYKLILFDYLILLISSILTSSIIVVFPDVMRFPLKTIMMILIYEYIFEESISKTTISVFLIYILIIASEGIFVILFIFFLNIDKLFLEETWQGIIITNLFITPIIYALSKIKKLQNLFRYIISWYRNNDVLSLIIVCLTAELTMFSLLYQIYANNISNIYFILCIIFLTGVIIFIVGFFKQKSDNGKLLHDYDQLLEYSKIYERELIDKSKKQHEYKNQLIIIENMIEKPNQEVIDYIKSLINDYKDNKDYRLIKKLTYIKSDGLKGLVYYKLKEMENKKLNPFLDVSTLLGKNKIWKICDQNLKDISRCLGVYIDNAIEASLLSKEKEVVLEFILEDDEIVFTIANTFKGKLDIENFDKDGYSSKGKDRGYGLSLVRDIICSNENLRQTREINGPYYIQKLYVKTKENL